MEIEKLRRILAEEAMGWECCVLNEDGACELWSGVPGVGPVRAEDWHPWDNWEQCGMVIEAMRAKGWRWETLEFGDGSISSSLRRGPGEYATAGGIGEKEVRMFAAVRGLESERPPETEEEVDDFLRAHGYDPGVVTAQGREVRGSV